MNILDQLEYFMSREKAINEWLDDGILRVYVRKSIRCIYDTYINTFDVANIEQIHPDYEGKGYFKQFMLKVESFGLPVYVESIRNPILVDMLMKNGYNILSTDYTSSNAIKFINITGEQ